ncbi:MAG: phenylacetate--CoA ligase family protein [Thermoanaerobaculales bacterium]
MARVLRAPVFDAERLAIVRDRRLRRLVAHAYARVPYYRRLFDGAGVRPEEIRSAADLIKLPITSKADLRRLPAEDLVASGADLGRCLHPRSSGTSGEPLTVYWNAGWFCAFLALTVRALRMAGVRPTDTLMVIGPGYYPEGLLVQRLGIGRVRSVSPLQEPAALAAALAAERPDALHAYGSVLRCLVKHARDTGRALHRPRVVVSSADYLDEATRRGCLEVMGVAPVQMYGAVETGRIGNECRLRDGLHLFTDFVVPELIPVAGDPAARRVVLSDLTNFTMPFIRYDQGDLAEAVDRACGCGLAFPRIRLLSARANDVVRLPSGAMVSALRLGKPLCDEPGVDAFKVVQQSESRLVVRVVKRDGCDDAGIRAAVAGIGTLLPGMRVDLEIVESIAPNPSGKVTRFQSLAPTPLHAEPSGPQGDRETP